MQSISSIYFLALNCGLKDKSAKSVAIRFMGRWASYTDQQVRNEIFRSMAQAVATEIQRVAATVPSAKGDAKVRVIKNLQLLTADKRRFEAGIVEEN